MVVVTTEPYPETEPMLNTAITETSSENYDYRRNSCTEEAYKNIRSSMKADPLQIACPKLGCELLLTAVNVKNITLAEQCIEYLDAQLNRDTVLPILSHLTKCKLHQQHTTTGHVNNLEPSAPPIIDTDTEFLADDWVEKLTDNLRHNCLLEIDRNADYVLKQKNILTLTYNDLLAVLSRDTLMISSETLVYGTVMKWGIEECRRRKLQSHYIQEVLRSLCFAPRYGLMSKKEFKSRTIDGVDGPTRSGILDEKMWRKILFYIKEKAKARPVEELPFKMSEKRILGNEKPNILSLRSTMRHVEPIGNEQCTNNTTCQKIFLNVLGCWSAVFD